MIASSVSGATRFVRWFRPRYAMFGSLLVMNVPRTEMDLSIKPRSSPRSSCAASETASNRTACSALFLFTLRTAAVPCRMPEITSTSACKYSGSSGVGKYCSARRHFTCSHGDGNR